MPQMSSHIDLRPITQGLAIIPRAKSASRISTGEFSRRNTIKSDSVADENLSLGDIENLLLERIKDKKEDLKAAFEAFDQEGNKTVTKGEFRRVIEGFLVPLTESQFEGLLAKIGGNLKNITRAFRLFDYNSDGQIQQHELRKVLERYCFPMSQLEFHRLWSHYSMNNSDTISYKEFLEKLGVDCENYRKIAPDSIQLALNWDTVSRAATRPKSKTSIRAFSSKSKDNLDEVQTRFLSKIKKNYSLVEKALQAFDITDSGFVSQEDLRSVLSNFLFPMDDNIFRELLNRACAMENISWIVQRRHGCTVKQILTEKLSENYDMLIETINSTTQNQSDTIPLEDLKRLIQQHGLPLSEHHFSKLCEPFLEGGNVNYKLFLKSLGVPETTEGRLSIFEREEKAQEASMLNIKAQAVKDVVLRKLKDRLQRHGMSLQDYLMSKRKSMTVVLTLRDFCKILDDCGIYLEGPQFQMLIESLGFNLGSISVTDFVAKYEEVTIPEKDKGGQTNLHMSTLLTAEDCLAQLKKRIKEYHGDTLTAFRLMDKNRDGVVNRNDFRALFDSLMFVTQEKEYQRLADLLGLTPGCTLNYAEFHNKVLSSSKMKSHHLDNTSRDGYLDIACDQVHDYLAAVAQKRPSELLKAFCQLGDDVKSIMTKNGLKQLLFKYYMPITPNEFEKLWCRYDEGGNGFVTQVEFLRKLQVTSDEDSQSDALQEQPTERTISTPDLDVMLQNLRKWIERDFENVSGSLVVLDKNKDGHVTVTDLLSLLYRHGFRLTEPQLTHLLNLLGFDGSLKELPYLDFLKHLAGPQFSSGSAVEPSQGPSVGSPEPVEDVEVLSPERAIQRVKELVTASSDTLYKAFSAFDKTGDGVIPQTEFRQVLDHFCMRLSDVQFRKLLSELRINEGKEIMIDWKEFLQAFNLHKQETADEWLKKIHKMRFPNQPRPLVISDILRRVQEVVSARIYTIAKEIVDLDYANINTISKTDFKTICDRHFMRLTNEQFEDLWKMLPVNGFGNLEYREFLKKFSGEQPGQEKVAKSLSGSARSALERPASLRRPKTAPCAFRRSLSSVSEQLQRPSTASRRSTPLLNCEDVEMKGLHIELSPLEFEQLAVKYDIKNSGRLSYPDFLRHFVLMFSPQVNTSSHRLKLQLPRTPMSPGPLSGQCAEAMLRISRPIQLFWRQMRQKFIAFDNERTGKISLQDFRKVLRQYSVNLSEEEFFHFTSFFDKNLSGKISYNDFLRIFLK
ncbi:EF-hand calcium-binding domain-containing 6 [Labeo rohita]|uniref:EF-hand calcium-binding domain-containing 6 n=1 Tax=Labeo rohita TaxID=84645 RepID=A0A498MRQ9_LABRO|nr:EF-hand calcium-binding domain-containing 6 [Labeo rohita]